MGTQDSMSLCEYQEKKRHGSDVTQNSSWLNILRKE